jgi:XRE family aerobic/anaerobic benzoate catabolism transcriptional regulator
MMHMPKNPVTTSKKRAQKLAFRADVHSLKAVGERVRKIRAQRGMTRRMVAEQSGVSERYLAQLESGQCNISILLLGQIAHALNVPIEVLVAERAEPSVEFAHITEFLRTLRPEELMAARQLLVQRFRRVDLGTRSQRIALIGLRGAGKSTLGAKLAEQLGVPFIELDRLIEQEAGVALSVIFDLYGQPGFRRLERHCLDQVLERFPRFVLATGGSLVSESATFERLLSMCFTVWLRATPQEHMQRVVAQGDMRPMAHSREAMADLQRILDGRQPLYSQADFVLDTSGQTIAESSHTLLRAVREAQSSMAGAQKHAQ